MEIYDGQSFVKYLDKVKARTSRLFDFIPEDKIEWTYQNGKFTIGDQIRHLAAIERFMYVENVQLKPSKYQGCGIV
ncbi:DinB family protein [Ekhidna sp.]|uniref:DinB family protein n=1 Tax=Ekhidna sp. TaxID=2608089 RepID=UPI0032985F04